MTTRVAIYARYSSDNQRDTSIEDQLREARRRCQREGWKVVGEYADHAISGATWRQRPEVQRLVRDAQARKFEVVLAEGLDRLSRDQENIAGLYKVLTFANVRIVTLSEGDINELHIGLKGTMNAMFLKDLADKVRRGQRGLAGRGRVASGIAYGYRAVPVVGKEDRGERVIVPEQAEIIRRIFRQYAAGISPEKIARQLNKEKVPGPRGHTTWHTSTIQGTWQRGTGILNNEAYVGRLVWGKLRFRKNPETEKRTGFLAPEPAIERCDVPALRIVDDALWQAVKARQLKTRAPRGSKPTNRPVYLLSGLTYCGTCGGVFAVQYRSRLCCRNKARYQTCDNKRTVSREEIEARVLKAMQKFVSIEAFDRFCKVYVEKLNELRREDSERVVDIPKEIKALGDRQLALFEFVRKGVGVERFTEEIRQLEVQVQELKAQLAREAHGPKPKRRPALHPHMAGEFQRRTRGLIAALDNGSEEQRQQARDTLRGFIDKIIVPPSGDLKVVGNLGALLAAATGWDGETLDISRMTAAASGARLRCCQALHIIAA